MIAEILANSQGRAGPNGSDIEKDKPMMRLPKTFAILLLAAMPFAGLIEGQPTPARSRDASAQPGVAEQKRLVSAFNNEVLQLYSESENEKQSKALIDSSSAEVFQKRAVALRELIRQDPAAALVGAFPPDVAARLANSFPNSAAEIETYGSFSGVYEVQIEDREDDAVTFRAVRTAQGRLALHMSDDELESAAGAQSGEWIEASGVRLGTEVAVEALNGPMEKLDLNTAEAASCSTIGAQRIAVIKVKFPGQSYSLPNANVRNWMFGSTGETLNRFWQENSSGAAWATGDVFPSGTDAWYTLNREYSCDEADALRDAALKAANSAVDFRNYSRVIVIFPRPSTGCSYAGRSSVGCWLSNPDGGSALSYTLQAAQSMPTQTRSLQLTAHESGHQLGLYHAAAVEYGTDAIGSPTSKGTRLEYGDRYSAEGFWNSGHYAAPHKYRLGWLQNVRQVSASGVYRLQESSLAPNSSGGAVQALQIARGSQKLWVEFRRRLGDFWSSAVSNPSSGALLHLDNGNAQTLLLDFTPQSASSSGGYYSADFNDATLSLGKTWQDRYTDLNLTVTSASNSGLDLAVNYGKVVQQCATAAPNVTVSPSSQSVTYPNSVSYTVGVRNNDSDLCSTSTFDLSALTKLNGSLTSEVVAQLAKSAISVSPGRTALTTVSVKAAAAPAQAKSYVVEVRAARGGQQGAGSAGLTVMASSNKSPSVSISAPSNGATIQQTTSIAFRGSASDPEDGNISSKLIWRSSRDGQIGTGASFSKQLTAGTHTITASVKDKNGATASRSITLNMVASNRSPSVAILAPSYGATFQQSTAVAFRGSASDPEDGDLSAKLVWRSSLDGQIGTGASFSKQLRAGTHTIYATATDKNGAKTTRSISITVVSSTSSGGTTAMRVASMDMLAVLRGDQSAARVTIRLVNSSGQALSGAAISGYWTLNGQLYYTALPFSTDSSGVGQTAWAFKAGAGSRIGFVVTAIKSSVYSGPFSATKTVTVQ